MELRQQAAQARDAGTSGSDFDLLDAGDWDDGGGDIDGDFG
jgi:hypothetical protein